MVADNGWTWPAAWLPTTRQQGLYCQKNSRLFNAKFQGDWTTVEVESTHISSLYSGKAIWYSFLPHVLVAFIFCCVRNRIETFLQSKISLWTKSFSSEVYVYRRGQNSSDLQPKTFGAVFCFDSWYPTQGTQSREYIQMKGCLFHHDTNVIARLISKQ